MKIGQEQMTCGKIVGKPKNELRGRCDLINIWKVVSRSRLRWFGHIKMKIGDLQGGTFIEDMALDHRSWRAAVIADTG